MKCQLWINLYPGYGYNVYSSKEQADDAAGHNRIECRKIEWNATIRVAEYLVPFAPNVYNNKIYDKRTHPIGQQPEGSVMVPNSEREQE